MGIHKIDVGDAPSVADRIFESLRRAVISGALKDGDPLRQEELARHFNASRIPVREALTRLEQHGLAQIRRFHGYTVAQMSRQQIEEICRFRALVEDEVVACAAAWASDETLTRARQTCRAFAEERDPVCGVSATASSMPRCTPIAGCRITSRQSMPHSTRPSATLSTSWS